MKGKDRRDGLVKGFNSPDEVRSRRLTALVAGIVIGVCVALVGVWTYDLAGAPVFCGSCHSMGGVYRQWQASRHKQFGCIECHIPVGGPVVRVGYKAWAGVRDLYHETMRTYGAAASPSAGARKILNDNCVRCHFSTIEAVSLVRAEGDCLRCHVGLVHGRMAQRGGLPIESKN